MDPWTMLMLFQQKKYPRANTIANEVQALKEKLKKCHRKKRNFLGRY